MDLKKIPWYPVGTSGYPGKKWCEDFHPNMHFIPWYMYRVLTIKTIPEIQKDYLHIPNTSMKQGSLFCHSEISQTTALHAVLLVSLESSWWVGVHRLGLRLFGATVLKLLIIEPFSQWKLNKIQTENCIGIFGVVGKPSVSQIQ